MTPEQASETIVLLGKIVESLNCIGMMILVYVFMRMFGGLK